MKRSVRAPFFETGVKNYIYGDAVIEYARQAETAAERHDVDVIFIAPYTELRTIGAECPRLILLAPYMDTLRPGPGIADVLPEALRAAGADGVVLNHVEKPMTLQQIRATIARADELDLLTFVCADSVAESRALAHLGPDIMNPEPSELIGTGTATPMSYVRDVIEAVSAIDSTILVEQAAGITTAQQVFDFIMAGSQGAGAASGILRSADPAATLDQMVAAVARARAALQEGQRA
jgi:triosephosphate isomerase